jgi:hypothetical protein
MVEMGLSHTLLCKKETCFHHTGCPVDVYSPSNVAAYRAFVATHGEEQEQERIVEEAMAEWKRRSAAISTIQNGLNGLNGM